MERSDVLDVVRGNQTNGLGLENRHHLRTSQPLGLGYRPRRSRQQHSSEILMTLRALPRLASSLLRVPILVRVFGERCSRTTRLRSHVFVSVVF
jgi:hypothetical protein